MSDKYKKTEDLDKISDEIVEETMREIYDELQAAKEKKSSDKENREDDKEKEAFSEADEEDYRIDVDDELFDNEDHSEEVESDFFDLDEEEIDSDEFDDYDKYDELVNSDEFEEMKKNDETKETDEDDDMEDPRLVKHRRKKRALIIVACIIGVFALAYVGVSVFFMSHFYINTQINGTDFSAKSIEEVVSYMESQVSNYKLTLLESDGGREDILGESISLEYVNGKQLKELLDDQNPFLWFTAFWEKPEIEAEIGVQFDQEKLQNVIANLICMRPEEQIESVSAIPEFQITEFVVKPEVIGTQIDVEKFTQAVSTAISGFQHELDMKEAGCYILPRFVSDSPEVVAAKDAMNSYLGAHITYDFSPHTEVVDASVISQWVKVDGEMNVTFNEEDVRGYIQVLADKYNTYGKPRTFTTGYGNTVEVSGGAYGWLIDQESEYDALISNIQNGEVVTREPVYSRRGATHEGYDFGNTYVEVDLTNQHMFFFQNGQLMLESDIVTGNPNQGHATPQGTYQLAYKARDQVLRGKKLEDGTYEYESPVSYWMPFNGGIGLHDANWQSAFGGSRYLTHGSHGCVNLPPSVAATLYGYLEAGMPVICHY